MKAYIHDNLDTDSRDAHDSGVAVSQEELGQSGVLYYNYETLDQVNDLAEKRNYKNRDVLTLTVEGLGGKEQYASKLKTFYGEHLHEDEEIRYILDGEGFFDIRDKADRWVRILVEKNDLLIVPAGIYHRFTPSRLNYVKAMRLFKDEPKWEAKPRPTADDLPIRSQYLQSVVWNKKFWNFIFIETVT